MNIINAFTVNFEVFNAYLLNKFFILMVSVKIIVIRSVFTRDPSDLCVLERERERDRKCSTSVIKAPLKVC